MHSVQVSIFSPQCNSHVCLCSHSILGVCPCSQPVIHSHSHHNPCQHTSHSPCPSHCPTNSQCVTLHSASTSHSSLIPLIQFRPLNRNPSLSLQILAISISPPCPILRLNPRFQWFIFHVSGLQSCISQSWSQLLFSQPNFHSLLLLCQDMCKHSCPISVPSV